MVGSKGFLSQWQENAEHKKLREDIHSQVIFWPKSKIRKVFPHGYDLSKVNRRATDPEVIERSITGILVL